MKNKTIFLLIGPKGGGKSFIGSLIEERFGIEFIRVESWAQNIQKGRAIDNASYIRDVFETIESGIRSQLGNTDQVVFESTGLTDYFDQMIENLQLEFKIVTILVEADKELCLTRVKERDQSIHVNVSDAQVNHINKLVNEKRSKLKYDHIIANNNSGVDHLIKVLRPIVAQF